MADLGKFLGNTVGEGAAFAAGLAVAPALAPLLRALENETWSRFPDQPLDAQTVAQAVAEGHITEKVGAAEAALTGISPARFQELVTFARVGPGVGLALQLWRRGLTDDTGVALALERAGLEPEWITALTSGGIEGKGLKHIPLTDAQIALGIIRSLIKDPGFMPVTLDVRGGKVPSYPQSTINALQEAALSGLDEERLRVLVGQIGLPMSLQQAASAVFRGIIERTDFNRAVLEGDTRPEYADAIFEQARQIITAHDWVELRLRGWVDDAQMYAGTALHGMSQADTDLLFKVLGRPIPVHQITTGLARGGVFNGPVSAIPLEYLRSLEQSNQRPEWYNLSYANRYSYPSAFVIKALATAGDFTQAETQQILLEIGWPPKYAALVSQKWASGVTGPGSKAVTSGTSAAVRAVQKAYVAGNTSRTTAEGELTTLGEDPATYPALFTAWDVQRTATLQGLTNLQIRNRYRNLGLTLDEATAILVSRGVTATEANTYLTYTASGQPPVPPA